MKLDRNKHDSINYNAFLQITLIIRKQLRLILELITKAAN